MTLGLAIVALAASVLNAQDVTPAIYGHWKVTRVVDSSPVTAMSTAQAKALVGGELTISPHSIRFNGKSCGSPSYEVTRQNAAEFLQDSKLDLKKLDLPDPVTRVDAECMYLFIRDANRIVFDREGFFYEAERKPSVHTRKRLREPERR